jgi:tetratricopeptide (TPR) repeat protein
LTFLFHFANLTGMARAGKARGGRSSGASKHRTSPKKSSKKKPVPETPVPRGGVLEVANPEVERQLKHYEEAIAYFQQQKFLKAKQALERVIAGPSKQLADRAVMHPHICEQRIAKPAELSLRSAEDYYHHGVAMMNLGRWDDARAALEKAQKISSKADYVVYALAALDCLTGETESAMENLKQAIALRPENRYLARNDEDFAYLQEDPRFTELLYPEGGGA